MTSTATDARADVLDLGAAGFAEKGQHVWVAATATDKAFEGRLSGVDMKDGVPYTASVWTGQKHRQVLVERVSLEAPQAKSTSKRASSKATARPDKILPRPEESNVTTKKSTSSKPATKRAPAKATAAKAAPAKPSTSNGKSIDMRDLPYLLSWAAVDGSKKGGPYTGNWGNCRRHALAYMESVGVKHDAAVKLLADAGANVKRGKGGTYGKVKITVAKR